MKNALSALLMLFALTATVSAREWSDASGKFRIEAELIAVRNGKAVLEKADGSIISVPVEKLSAADQAHLKSLEPAAAPKPAPMQPEAPRPARPSTTGEQARVVLEKYCHRCHGADGASEGGFNFVLDLPKLATTYVKPKQAQQSALLERMTDTGDSAMPPAGEEPRPSAAEINIIKTWIDAGAPPPANTLARKFISQDEVVRLIRTDLEKTTERSRRFVRYFTLTHLHNLNVSDDELQTYRNAFTKLVNSLSWNSDLVVPTAIDPDKTILRVDIREVQWSEEIWQEIEAANPYFLAASTPDALLCYDQTQTKMPYVRADWFVFAASKPPLYHTVLGIPNTDIELEQNLRVNAEANIRQEKVLRAGFNRSGVSQNNRLIERHKSPYGSYWKSYDFGGNTDRQNLFEHPLGPNDVDEPFKHDGGELIFTLPNGLQGYMLVDARGKRIDKGPTDIVSDPKQADRTVTNGVSCMSCHYTGVIPKNDEIGPFVRANPKAFENPEDILALYREADELAKVYDSDAQAFASAMKQIGIQSLSRSGEPISAMAARFEQELDVTTVACEFGLPQEDFEKRLANSQAMARSFGALRTPGGTIKRDVFATMFGQAAVEFRLSVDVDIRIGSRLAGQGTAKLKGSDAENPMEIRRIGDLSWGLKSVAFSPSGGQVAGGKNDDAILVFDADSKAKLHDTGRLDSMGQISACEYTPDGKHLLAGGNSGTIQVYEVASDGTIQRTGQFAGHSKEITAIAVSLDSKRALSGSTEEKVRYWQIDTGRELGVFDGFKGKIKAAHISANGRSALATDGNLLLHIDLTKMEVTKKTTLTASWASGQSAAISPDGELVAAGDSYHMRVWEVATGKELPKLEGNEIQWSATFTPDSKRLLTGGNGKVNVWDVRKQQRLASLDCPSGYVHCISASPDNKHAAAGTGPLCNNLSIFSLPAASK